MTKPAARLLSLGAILFLATVVAACGGTSGPAASSCSKTWKVGLVTDVGKLSDKSFNFDSYKGVQDAQADSSLCVQGKAIESSTEDDYPKNIGQFVDQKYDMIVTVGFKLGDATIKAAKANPSIKFVMVDFGDFTDNPVPSNLVGLLFKEDQPGFLDVDQYVSYPDVDSCLITSAEKHLDKAVKTAITSMVQGSFKSGILNFDMSNDGVGLAPFHDFDSKISSDVKAKVADVQAKLKAGTITTGVSS